MKSKTIAILICFFLGGFGAHKFYLGNKKHGKIYLIFFWTGVPYIVSFVDLFILIFQHEYLFNKTYNSEITLNKENIKSHKNTLIIKPDLKTKDEYDLDRFLSASGSVGSTDLSDNKLWKVTVTQKGEIEIDEDKKLKFKHKIKGAKEARIANNGRVIVLVNGSSSIHGKNLNSALVLIDGLHIDSLTGEPALILAFDISPKGNTVLYSFANSPELKNNPVRVKGMNIDERKIMKFDRPMSTSIKFISESQALLDNTHVLELEESLV